MTVRRTNATWLLVSLFLFLAACSGKNPTGTRGTGGSGTLASISVTPTSTSVSVSAQVSFKATGIYSDGSSKDLTASAQWASSDSGTASMTPAGIATGMAAGTATISAQSSGMTGSATLTVSASGGSGGGGGDAGKNLTSIAVTPLNPSVPVNTVQQLTASGSYSDGSSADLTSLVTWTSSVVSKANVNATGAVTGVAAGSASITAALNGISGSTTVTVTAPSITAISVSPDGLTLPIDITQQFVATATYSDGSSQDLAGGVTWSSSSTSVATIDNTGLASLLAAGTVTITAKVGSLSDTATVTVVGAHLTSIAITPATPTMAAGTEQQFTATGIFDDGSTQLLPSVQWSATSPNILTVNATGLGVAVAGGNSTLSATSGSITGTTSITVTSATLVSLAIAPLTSSMPVGATKQFTATGTFSDNSTQDVTQLVLWKSSDAAVASISATGLASSFVAGTTTIQAQLGSQTQSTTLTVSVVDLVSIAITPANPTLAKGTSVRFTATGTYSDGSTAVLTAVSWKSSKPQIANVRGTGIVHAKKAGQATITATAFGVKGTTTLTVGTGTLNSITITPANTTVSAHATQQFAATGKFSDGSTQDVTLNSHWSSSVAPVATIANGPPQAALATTYTHGTTTIGANSGGVTASTTLSVN
jgi:uncharacterized protein YjdB